MSAWWQSSDSEEWYTPADVVAAARSALGGIDLDPASCADANTTVQAAHYFTREDDGLSREWFGRVWMNPPFGRPIAKWTRKLREEYEAGRVKQAIALIPARLDTRWYRDIEPAVSLTCHMSGRLRFRGATSSAPFPTALLYLGTDDRRFRRAFHAFGRFYRHDSVTDSARRCVTCGAPLLGRADALACGSACRQRAYRARQAVA